MLALPADHLDFDQAKKIVDAFITTPGKTEEKYLRRLAKLDQI
jgi:ribose 5-phosphate isomerase RpiB